jgi:ferredoxin
VPPSVVAPAARLLVSCSALDGLLAALLRRGYTLIGPRVVGHAITYRPIQSMADLPHGWSSEQAPGRYRLAQRADEACFAYGPAFESLKQYVYPHVERLWAARRDRTVLRFEPTTEPPARLAIVGVRSCELEAIARLDRVFVEGDYVDPSYRARREAMFLVAANCVQPAGTCFCASMDTGPRARRLFDLALTEISGGRFVVDVGTDSGAEMTTSLDWTEAPDDAVANADQALEAAATRMGRQVATDGLAEHLAAALEHPAWDDVARRCLACANCTMVCPTCFCHTVNDLTDLSGHHVERVRRWDTCFSAEFSYIHGGSIRPSVRARYRQWLTHKFSSSLQQFGTTGCVGCGRCITWCPVGIDVTEEIRRLREG